MSLVTLTVIGGYVWLELQLRDKAAELETVLQTIANKEEVQRQQQELVSLLEQSAADREAIARLAINGQEGSIAFLGEVERLAAAHGIELASARLETEADTDLGVDLIKLTYSVEGESTRMSTFIKSLEALPYASYVDSLTLAEDVLPGTGVRTATGALTIIAVGNEIES